MVYTNPNNDDFIVNCSCSCGEGIEFKFEYDQTQVYLNLMIGRWYSDQNNSFCQMKEKLKRIWMILRNKEYHYAEIIMTQNDYKLFKETVNKVRFDKEAEPDAPP